MLMLVLFLMVPKHVRDSLKTYWENKLGVKIEQMAIVEEKGKPVVKAVVTSDDIKFLDETGKVKKTVSRWGMAYLPPKAFPSPPKEKYRKVKGRVQITHNGKYIGLTIPLEIGYEGIFGSEFKVYTTEGKKCWSIESGAADIDLSPSGRYAVGISYDEHVPRLYFLSPNKVQKLNMEQLLNPPIDFLVDFVRFTQDGSKFAIYCGGRVNKNEVTYVALYDSSFKLIFQKVLEGSPYRMKLFNKNNTLYLMLVHKDVEIILNEKGKIIKILKPKRRRK